MLGVSGAGPIADGEDDAGAEAAAAAALEPNLGSEYGEEFSCEMVDIGWVANLFPPDVVVQHAPLSGFVDVRQGEIHAVTFDGTGYAADEEHGAVRFLPLDDSNVRQRVVHLAIPVVVPCIVEEDEIARVGNRPLVKRALLLYMRVDEADSICFRIALAAAI
jgi:hypothetical protein